MRSASAIAAPISKLHPPPHEGKTYRPLADLFGRPGWPVTKLPPTYYDGLRLMSTGIRFLVRRAEIISGAGELHAGPMLGNTSCAIACPGPTLTYAGRCFRLPRNRRCRGDGECLDIILTGA
jgi:hypothetical protein